MKYINAFDLLPDKLINEIQKFVHGEFIYIPVPKSSRKKWGEDSGHREYILNRNHEIRKLFLEGSSIDQLMETFYLSYDSIKKIVYNKKPYIR